MSEIDKALQEGQDKLRDAGTWEITKGFISANMENAAIQAKHNFATTKKIDGIISRLTNHDNKLASILEGQGTITKSVQNLSIQWSNTQKDMNDKWAAMQASQDNMLLEIQRALHGNNVTYNPQASQHYPGDTTELAHRQLQQQITPSTPTYDANRLLTPLTKPFMLDILPHVTTPQAHPRAEAAS